MFQQRHFEAMATMMQELHPAANEPTLGVARRAMLEQWNRTHDELVRVFLRSNSRFDVGRFERACEPGANVRKRSA